jgi:hypothetical protein
VAFAVVINTREVERVAQRLAQIDAADINRASLRAVNLVGERAYKDSLTRMTKRINWSRAYLEERMEFVAANDERKPQAKVVAFRGGSGSKKSALRPSNLRQFAPRQISVPVKFGNEFANGPIWTMSDGRRAAQMLRNPRRKEKRLPFILRTGSTLRNIPVGKKQAGMSFEFVKGRRVVIPYAFLGDTKKGSGVLVMQREKTDRKGKGKMKAMYRLQAWSVFKKTAAVILPFVRKDLEKTVGDNVTRELARRITV